jgi:hypothetical protein
MLLDKVNSFQADTLLSSEVYAALNMAQEMFVKQRYGRANKYGKGFEENQKRMDDIAPLVLDALVTPDYSESIGNGFHRDVVCQLPAQHVDSYDYQSDLSVNSSPNFHASAEYMFLISVRVHISYKGCKIPLEEDSDWEYVSGPFQGWQGVELGFVAEGQSLIDTNHEVGITHLGKREILTEAIGIQNKFGVLCKHAQNDDIFEILKDPFNGTTVDGPLYTMSGFVGSQPNSTSPTSMNRSQIEIYTDNTFVVDTVSIRYIKKPEEITSGWGCQLAEHTHMEIVNMAVDLLLESMSDPRYKSHQMETLKSD